MRPASLKQQNYWFYISRWYNFNILRNLNILPVYNLIINTLISKLRTLKESFPFLFLSQVSRKYNNDIKRNPWFLGSGLPSWDNTEHKLLGDKNYIKAKKRWIFLQGTFNNKNSTRKNKICYICRTFLHPSSQITKLRQDSDFPRRIGFQTILEPSEEEPLASEAWN